MISELTEKVANELEKNPKKAVILCQIDLEQMFDLIPADKLLDKLKEHRIGGNFLYAYKELLFNRKMRVVDNQHKSSWRPISGNVLQGASSSSDLANEYLKGIGASMKAVLGARPST